MSIVESCVDCEYFMYVRSEKGLICHCVKKDECLFDLTGCDDFKRYYARISRKLFKEVKE